MTRGLRSGEQCGGIKQNYEFDNARQQTGLGAMVQVVYVSAAK
jgi:hypothetical protein